MLILASTQRTIFWVVAALVMIGFVVYLLMNIRTGAKEIGSEIELAPNRKEYFDDDDMETKRLDIALFAGVGTLAIVALSLPLYWLGEPGRQDGREDFTIAQFAGRGEGLYEENCVACHAAGGLGGVAPYTVLDEAGRFVAASEWEAPALTAVLNRFDVEELTEILQWGRPQSPMPAWGGKGGGPLTDQQLEEIIEYIKRIQLDEPSMQVEITQGMRDAIVQQITSQDAELFTLARTPLLPDTPAGDATEISQAREDAANAMSESVPGLGDLFMEEMMLVDLGAEAELEDLTRVFDATDALLDTHYANLSQVDQGELLFNNPAGAGAYGCARCHTAGASWNADGVLAADPDYLGLIQPEVPGGGGLGPSLVGVATAFASAESQEAFIHDGCEIRPPKNQYGLNGFCDSGQMPGFGVMLTDEQIAAIVAYERGLE